MYLRKASSPFIICAFALAFAGPGVHSASLSNFPHENTLHKRFLSSVAVIGGDQANLACTDNQRAVIDSAINDARALATAASAILEVPGSEDSEAYGQWFGPGSAGARDAIRTNNYGALLADLNQPTSVLVEMTTANIDATGLTLACGAETLRSCGNTVVAVAHQADDELPGHLIMLCPKFFALPSNQAMLGEILTGRFTDPSQGFALVHEVQHLSTIVSAGRRCADQVDTSGAGCYSVACCTALPDNLKILNAQNMAFFAADVSSDPSRGAPPQQNTCAIQKRSGPFAEDFTPWAQQYTSLRTVFRRQATPNSTVVETVPAPEPTVADPTVPASSAVPNSPPEPSVAPPVESSAEPTSQPPPATTDDGGGVPIIPPDVPPAAPAPPGDLPDPNPTNPNEETPTEPPTSTADPTTTQDCTTGASQPFPTGNAPPDQDGFSADDIAGLNLNPAPAPAPPPSTDPAPPTASTKPAAPETTPEQPTLIECSCTVLSATQSCCATFGGTIEFESFCHHRGDASGFLGCCLDSGAGTNSCVVVPLGP